MDTAKENQVLEAIDKYKGSIVRICKIYASSYMDSSDLFQEVVFNIWNSYKSFENRSTIGTWIYKIALNTCLRYKMKLDKHKSTHVKLESVQFYRIPKNENTAGEKIEHLHFCINKLSEVNKSIVLLYLEDLSYKEISQIIGLTENHIAVKMKRIRESLLNCLNKTTT
jgi:RNA polymerase sigma factor (sigma-70 family)